MDLNIAGKGTISAGDYDEIVLKGKMKSMGEIRCKNFKCDGKFSGVSDIDCKKELKLSGDFKNEGSIKADRFIASGKVENEKTISADSMKLSGVFTAQSDVKTSKLKASGKMDVKGNLKADKARITGMILNDGGIDVDDLHIDIATGMCSEVKNIKGKEIQIERKLRNPIITLFKKIVKSKAGVITVAEAIEGEDIKLEYTIAKRVTGRRINIGKGCQIELVQYSDSVEVSPKATVRTKEQV